MRATCISVRFSPWQQLLISQRMKLISLVGSVKLDTQHALFCFLKWSYAHIHTIAIFKKITSVGFFRNLLYLRLILETYLPQKMITALILLCLNKQYSILS